MMDTKSVNGNPNRVRLFALVVSLVLLSTSFACSSRSTTPTVPTLPRPSPPTPPPQPPTTTSSRETGGEAGGQPAGKPVGKPGATASEPGAEKPATDAGRLSFETKETGEEADGQGPASQTPTSRDDSPATADAGAAGGGPFTTGEKKEALDSDLHSSLSEFDKMLLREQEILAEEQAAEAAAAGNGASGGGGSMGGSFGDEEGGTQTADTGGDRAAGGGTGGSPDTPPGEASEAESPVGGDEDAASTNGRIPPDVGDGHDDDIVARQLREAAMNEEDPELREKLWEEYRAYKNGTTRTDN